LIACLALGFVALYLVLTVMTRLSEGRCRTGDVQLNCTFHAPVRGGPPAQGETVAAL
jgi:hypothetical protein